ncbi:MAG TPA: hypothetical protein VN326_19760 [Casimicrobiaceae bacterium]|nr:hypothetical protein [Casimicrobiaceae bacterium]
MERPQSMFRGLDARGGDAVPKRAMGILGNCLERAQEVIVFGRLVEKSVGADKGALPLIFRICVVGQHVDFRRQAGKLLAEFPHDFDSAAFLQTNVGDDDIRLRPYDRVNRLLLALRKTHDVKITQAFDVVDNAFSNQR